MSGTDFIGEIAQGALAARAVEPAHGEASDDGHTHESACLNCGAPLIGSHCHQCGQAAHVHKTLAAFFHDLLHGVFHFEGKTWRTLPLLAWRPGRLTREYIDGRRASYVSPIALFLFVVFLTFAVFNLLGSPIAFNNQGENKGFEQGIGEAEQQAVQSLATAEARLAEAKAGKGGDIARLEKEVDGARNAVAMIRAAKDGELPRQIASADTQAEKSVTEAINRAWQHARENPELTIYKLQTSAYKYSWLLIPLSVPFMWLLFPFSRRFRLYDHTVFVTYSLSFMLLLLAAMSALTVWGGAGFVVGALFFYAPFHMYRQLRDTYGLARFGAWWRTWFLSLAALLVLVMFATMMTLLVAV
ncbi:MAG: DUF3667 domain-containing protein [Sphingomonadaceae bacterium]|nr:DUF3667 domain-containing protein [Sphingomonadaceae bacterium]